MFQKKKTRWRKIKEIIQENILKLKDLRVQIER